VSLTSLARAALGIRAARGAHRAAHVISKRFFRTSATGYLEFAGCPEEGPNAVLNQR
jgi:hypothetical protein